MNQRCDTRTGKQSGRIEVQILIEILSTVLNPLVALENQACAIAELRQAIQASYTEREIQICDAFEKASQPDLQANIQLVLGLLRELHPNYYDLEHLHGIVESLEQRARNLHNIT